MPIDNNSAFIPGGIFAFVTDPNFDPGGIVDRVDNRDFTFSEVGLATPEFDWATTFDIEAKLGFKLPVKDQNGSGSCGGQAFSQLAGVLEAAATGTMEERSAKFFYAQTYQRGGGSTARDNATVYVQQGAARESMCVSYENGIPPGEAFMERGQDITAVDRQDAKSDMSVSYSQVALNIDEVARAIRDTNGVVLGISGTNNGTWLTAFPKPPAVVSWRHFMYAGKVKMINGVKHIGCLNSWGKGIGDPAAPGWQWLPELYFTSGNIWTAYTHVFAEPAPTVFKHNFATNITYGQTSAEVTALQTALKLEGVFPANVGATGNYFSITAQAVLDFRKKYGLSSSTDPFGHSVGAITRAKLNQLYSV